MSLASVSAEPVTGVSARMGINLAGAEDYATELPFVDVFRLARSWASQKDGAQWGAGPTLDIDEHGWVKKLEPGCWAEAPICTSQNGHYPSGRYTVLYEGKGTFDFRGGNVKIADAATPGRMLIDVDSSTGPGIFLQIRETSPDDYLRNIRVIMPGFEDTYQAEPFHPAFLKRWQGVACFRFIDWIKVDDKMLMEKMIRWEDRPKVDDATYTARGVPLEVIIDLCNRQKVDAWFCIPHKADDQYVRHFAEMVRDKLDPSLKAYIEYSNEVWNGIFSQCPYARGKAVELKLGEPTRPWEGACMFYVQRSQEVFKIWEEVFGGTDRLVRVLAWQAAASSFWLDGLLMSNATPGQVDALAIAPYISFNVSGTPKNPGESSEAQTVAALTVDQLLDRVEQKALPECIGWMKNAKQVADKYKVKLIAYEGGQHLSGVANGQNHDPMTQLFMQANAHERMGQIYTTYLNAWKDNGGGLFNVFNSVGEWGKYGSWGLVQFSDQGGTAATSTPKFLAVMRWAKSLGQPVNVPE
jgi:hypothetical protein